MGDMQSLEFKTMAPGQGMEVYELIRKALKITHDVGEWPLGQPLGGMSLQGQLALKRYMSPEAIEQRAQMGYTHELARVSGVLAGVIETRGADQISMLYIHPDYVNKGLGSRLIARAASRCSRIAPKAKQLTVYATDDTVDFYERVGFVRSGARKESLGIFSIPCKLSLETNGKSPATKLHSETVDLFVFTGTGNSLVVAQAVSEILNHENVSTRIRSMDKPCPADLNVETAIGLAFPVACFSTYPAVWRFIETMPAGEGREVFVLGTCGGMPFGMQGPLRKILSKKGYKPVGAKFLTMPGNYNNKTLKAEKNEARISKSVLEAQSFAYDLLNGGCRWKTGVFMLSSFCYRLGQTRKPWNLFYKIFPISADREKCVNCKRCAELCPAGAITMEEGCPVVAAALCESCQRCVGFCPTGALHVPGKPAEPYRAMSYEDFKAAFK